MAVPASWPIGDAYLSRTEAALPAVSYTDIFRDPRLQSLILQALANNRDLMAAAANIAGARERYHIQRASQLPQVDANAAVTATGARDSGVDTSYVAGASVPGFELDLFGRVRSLTHAQLQLYFATEAAARATRLALVASIADAWLLHAAHASLLTIAKETAKSAETSVKLTRARLEGGIAPRTDFRQAEQILTGAQAGRGPTDHSGGAGRQCAPAARRRPRRSGAALGLDQPGCPDNCRIAAWARLRNPAPPPGCR
jgi:multidrug efflux system outer membrane protein